MPKKFKGVAMVQIDDALLQRLQNLCMLEVKEKERIKDDLNRFLQFVEILDELDLQSVEEAHGAIRQNAPLREDIPYNDPAIPEMILKHAPKAEDDFFIVPKIIE